MHEETLNVVEIALGLLFCLMIITGAISLFNRRLIVKKLKENEEAVFDKYFSKSGLFNNDINTSKKKAKFFISKSMWENIGNSEVKSLLILNRKIEISYYASFALTFIIFISSIALMAYFKNG